MDDMTELPRLAQLLTNLEDEHGSGSKRLMVRLVSKHSNEVVEPEARFMLAGLESEVAAALKALAFVEYLKTLGREIVHP